MKFGALAAIMAILNVAACERRQSYTYFGEIDGKFVDFLANTPANTEISLSSNGGIDKYALEAAEIIEQNRLSLKVFGICVSACFDFILPAAIKIRYVDLPIVGSHGNTLFDYNLTKNSDLLAGTPDKGETCRKRAEWLSDIWARNDVSEKYMLDNIARLEPINIKNNGRYCAGYDLTIAYWLPNSYEMKTIFGDRVSGETCADSPDCLKNKVSKLQADRPVLSGGRIIRLQ